jgi:opacity protein-like surface antigen
MRAFTKWRLFLSPLLLSLTCALLSAQTAANDPSSPPSFRDDSWRMSVSPYLWMAGMNGTVGFAGRQVQVNQSFSDIFENLKLGVMGFSETRRGRIGLLTDLMYIRLGNETAIPVAGLPSAINVKTSLNTFTLTPYFSYRVLGNDRGTIDWIAGGRYYHIGAAITAGVPTLGNVSYSASDNWGDLVQGARFTLKLAPRINTFFIGDAGGGGSLLTWQIVGGATYRLSQRWSANLGYRRLYYNRQTGNSFVLEQTQQGLVLGATFKLR